MNTLIALEKQLKEYAGEHPLSVKGIIITADHKVLLLHRPDQIRWDLPGGGVDDGETLVEAYTREIQEETGMTIDNAEPVYTYLRIVPDKKIKLIQYVLTRHTADSSTIKVTLSKEHDSYQFFDLEDENFPILITSYQEAFKRAKETFL